MSYQVGAMWSSFGVHLGSRRLVALLSSPDTTLETILGDDELLQELKYPSNELLDFLGRDDSVRGLVQWASTPSENCMTEEQTFPFIAAEILCLDHGTITDRVSSSAELLETIFGLVYAERPLSLDRVETFRRVVGTLLQLRRWNIVSFVRMRPDIITRLVHHIGQHAMLEVLIMLTWNTGEVEDLEWAYKVDLIPQLVLQLDPARGESDTVHSNVTRALVDVVVKCPLTQAHKLVRHLLSPPMLERIFHFMFAGSKSSLHSSLAVLAVLLERSAKGFLAADPVDWGLSALITQTLDHIPRFVELLTTDEDLGPLPQSYGVLVAPLGDTRLKIVELFHVLFSTDYPHILDELIRFDVLNRILDLFFDYVWHNMLHGIVEALINAVLESNYRKLIISLFTDVHLLDRLREAHQRGVAAANEPGGFRAGNLGHIIRICAAIGRVEDPFTRHFIDESASWSEFVRTGLAAELDVQGTQIGGAKPPPQPENPNLAMLAADTGPAAMDDEALQRLEVSDIRLEDLDSLPQSMLMRLNLGHGEPIENWGALIHGSFDSSGPFLDGSSEEDDDDDDNFYGSGPGYDSDDSISSGSDTDSSGSIDSDDAFDTYTDNAEESTEAAAQAAVAAIAAAAGSNPSSTPADSSALHADATWANEYLNTDDADDADDDYFGDDNLPRYVDPASALLQVEHEHEVRSEATQRSHQQQDSPTKLDDSDNPSFSDSRFWGSSDYVVVDLDDDL